MKTVSKPKVSICIPNYNDAETLSQTIESAINQTYIDIRIIILDDGSEDSSLDIINEYAKKDSRIQVLYTHHEKMGLPKTINDLLDIVDTKFITLFYSDCIYSNFFVEIGMKIFTKYPDIVQFSTSATTDHNHFISDENNLNEYVNIKHLSPTEYRKMLYYGTSPVFLSSIFKKEIFDKYGHFPECTNRLLEGRFFYWLSNDNSIALHINGNLCYKKLHGKFELIHLGIEEEKLTPDVIRQSKEYIEEVTNEKDLLMLIHKDIPHDDLYHHCIGYHYYLLFKEYFTIYDKPNVDLYISLFINEMSKIKELPDTFYTKEYLKFTQDSKE